MRILYVVTKSVEINTSASIRNSGIISGLIDLGHTVTLLSTLPDKKSGYYDASLLPQGVKTLYLADGGSQKILDWLKRNSLLKPIKHVVSRYINKTEIYGLLTMWIK